MAANRLHHCAKGHRCKCRGYSGHVCRHGKRNPGLESITALFGGDSHRRSVEKLRKQVRDNEASDRYHARSGMSGRQAFLQLRREHKAEEGGRVPQGRRGRQKPYSVSEALRLMMTPRKGEPGYERMLANRRAMKKNPHIGFLGKYRCRKCGSQFKTGREAIEHLNAKHGTSYRLKPAPKAWARKR